MIIGFHGQMRSGKNLAAERFESLVAIPCIKGAFADKLKESASALFGISQESLDEYKLDPSAVVTLSNQDGVIAKLTVREFLQRYGTESHRHVFGDDFWIKQIDRDIPRDCLFLVTDVRFPNELEYVHQRGGVVIHIRSNPSPESWLHDSEQVLSGCDFLVLNHIRDDNFVHLDSQLVKIISELNIPLKS